MKGISNNAYEVRVEHERLERAIIGAILLEQSAIALVYNVIRDNYNAFLLEDTRTVYQVCCQLFQHSEPIEMITVGQKIISENLTEKAPLGQLAEYTIRVASTANLEFHAYILIANYTERIARQELAVLAAKEYDGIDDINSSINSALLAINKPLQLKGSKDTAQDLYDHILSMRKSGIRGYDTGINSLNRLATPAPGDLVIIAGRPGMGKTTLAVQLAEKYSGKGLKVDFYSFEMSAKELNLRRLSNATGLESEQIIKDASTDNVVINGLERVYQNADFRILNDARTASGIRANSMLRKQTVGLDCIIIDYLGLMEHPGTSTTADKIGETTKALKAIAQELKIPIIVLSQLSRSVENRGCKIPILADLRDSGNIEQDADIVFFVVRPSYYNQDVDDFGNAVTEKSMIVVCAKHRHGETGYTYVRADMNLYRVGDETPF